MNRQELIRIRKNYKNQMEIKIKSNRNQIKSKSKSSQIQSLGNPVKIQEILGNPSSIRNPRNPRMKKSYGNPKSYRNPRTSVGPPLQTGALRLAPPGALELPARSPELRSGATVRSYEVLRKDVLRTRNSQDFSSFTRISQDSIRILSRISQDSLRF